MNRLLFVVFVFLSSASFARYFHLELGAANYGQEGHTRKAVFSTYRANQIEIANEKTFFEGVTEDASQAIWQLVPEIQYYVLFRTLDELVRRHPGEEIIFHVNDLEAEWTEYAAEQLREYVAQSNYNVKVEAVPGNYFLLNSLETLAPWGESYYDSVHLKNPELMYSESVDGHEFAVSDKSRRKMREGLQGLANLGKRGLHFFIIDHESYFPRLERIEYSMQGSIYTNTSEWVGFGYALPDGTWGVPEEATHVFFVAASEKMPV